MLALLFIGCDDPSGVGRPPVSLAFASDTIIVEYRDSVDAVIELVDDRGEPVILDGVHWWSSKPDVAAVSEDGTVAGRWPGAAMLRAQLGPMIDSAVVVVRTRTLRDECNLGFFTLRTEGHAFQWTRVSAGYTEGEETYRYFGSEMLSTTSIQYGTDPSNLTRFRGAFGGNVQSGGSCAVPGGTGTYSVALVMPTYLGNYVTFPGLTIVQEQFAFADDASNDYVLFRYTLENDGHSDIVGLYFGVLVDLDIGSATDDVGSFDVSTGVADYVDIDSIANPRMGGALLIDTETGTHTAAFPSAALSATREERFGHLTSGLNGPRRTGVEDVRHLLATTPFDLAVGEYRVIWYAVAAGDNRNDFNASVAAAIARKRSLD